MCDEGTLISMTTTQMSVTSAALYAEGTDSSTNTTAATQHEEYSVGSQSSSLFNSLPL